MFEPAVTFGERVAVWHPGDVEPEPRLRVLPDRFPPELTATLTGDLATGGR